MGSGSREHILRTFFKPSVVWQDDNSIPSPPHPSKVNSPAAEEDEGIIGGSVVEETSSAHQVMVVITP